MRTSHPRAFAEIKKWAIENDIPTPEARTRFAQYGILRSIAKDAVLKDLLVFKGGNALDFVWEPNRSTRDLDFSADTDNFAAGITESWLKILIEPALAIEGTALNIAFALHAVEQQPPGKSKTFITFQARVGFALPDENRLRQRIESGKPSTNVIPIDISINEPIARPN